MEELFKNPIFATHAVAAAASVTFGTTLTYPVDTLKTLIQSKPAAFNFKALRITLDVEGSMDCQNQQEEELVKEV